LIESVLEPKLQSVKSFRMVAGSDEPRSNLEIEKWEDRLYPDDDGDELVTGANFRAEGESESGKCDSSYE